MFIAPLDSLESHYFIRLFPGVQSSNVLSGKHLINWWSVRLIYYQLCDDLFTFCTELKKVIIPIVKSSYDIFPKGTVTRKEDIHKHVTTAATKLLKTGSYLHVPDSSNVCDHSSQCGCSLFIFSRANGKILCHKLSWMAALHFIIAIARRHSKIQTNFTAQSLRTPLFSWPLWYAVIYFIFCR